jgi:putative N6-adenine-specific DNA methylase
VQVYASDINSGAVDATTANAERAGVGDMVDVSQADFLQIDPSEQYCGPGLLVANLPYGKRVGAATQTRGLYRNLANRLKRYWQGWRVGLVIPRDGGRLFEPFGIVRRMSFSNGGLPVQFVLFTVR